MAASSSFVPEAEPQPYQKHDAVQVCQFATRGYRAATACLGEQMLESPATCATTKEEEEEENSVTSEHVPNLCVKNTFIDVVAGLGFGGEGEVVQRAGAPRSHSAPPIDRCRGGQERHPVLDLLASPVAQGHADFDAEEPLFKTESEWDGEQLALAPAPPASINLAEQPPSGIELHLMRKCKPCAFHNTKGCRNGDSCPFCHLCTPDEKKSRVRQRWDAKRKQWRQWRQYERTVKREAALESAAATGGAAPPGRGRGGANTELAEAAPAAVQQWSPGASSSWGVPVCLFCQCTTCICAVTHGLVPGPWVAR